MSKKIIDCFIFYNEIDLLTYRLNILNNVVDYFVIVEATHTHVGTEKQLFFNDNKHLFENFSSKIIHVIVDDFPHKYPNIDCTVNDQWKNENYQRNAISRGIKNIDNLHDEDCIIISDLDEIPDPFTLNNIKKNNISITINILEQDLYYYNLHTKFINKWHSCKILSYLKYKELSLTCNDIRAYPNAEIILNGGWHLSYFGDPIFIKNKINNFTHQEYNNPHYTDISTIQDKIKNSKDLYNRHIDIYKITIKDNNYLPVEYEKYLIPFFQS
jgi:beta-1,4-mannosyl-glycoprotein beta-1,4-N-acetylglucosaminyltransferase